MKILTGFSLIVLCVFFTVAPAASQPPGWYQVNQDGFFPGGPTSGAEFFIFDGELYARDGQTYVKMENPTQRIWTQVALPILLASGGGGDESIIADLYLRPVSDYLYARETNTGQLWWIKKGADLTVAANWTAVTSQNIPRNASPAPLVEFNGKIYGVYYDFGVFEIYRSANIGEAVMYWEFIEGGALGDPYNNKSVAGGWSSTTIFT